MRRFEDRREAGEQLAQALVHFADDEPIVLALPRGGVPVGYEIARALAAPLDVWVVRKIGVPWRPELGVGAVSEGGWVEVNWEVVDHVGVAMPELEKATGQKRAEVEDLLRRFRGDRAPPVLKGRTVIVVDDGIATGATVRAAIRSIRAHAPAKLVLAVPVATQETARELAALVDHVVCLQTPRDLVSVGRWYHDFTQVSDAEVVEMLARSRAPAREAV